MMEIESEARKGLLNLFIQIKKNCNLQITRANEVCFRKLLKNYFSQAKACGY